MHWSDIGLRTCLYVHCKQSTRLQVRLGPQTYYTSSPRRRDYRKDVHRPPGESYLHRHSCTVARFRITRCSISVSGCTQLHGKDSLVRSVGDTLLRRLLDHDFRIGVLQNISLMLRCTLACTIYKVTSVTIGAHWSDLVPTNLQFATYFNFTCLALGKRMAPNLPKKLCVVWCLSCKHGGEAAWFWTHCSEDIWSNWHLFC